VTDAQDRRFGSRTIGQYCSSMTTKTKTVAAAVLILLAFEGFVASRYQGPQPVSARTNDSDVFSAKAALRIHHSIFPDEPHPAGSPAQTRVRRRLVTLLQSHGWAVKIQNAVVQNLLGDQIEIHNIIAHRPELAHLTAPPLVLSSHYDSCRFGPGAGDAAACVCAIVEAGRQLTSSPEEIRRPVFLVITDAEEDGLLGALQLVATGNFSDSTPVVLNFDARGTSGPVAMYETHGGNLTAVRSWIHDLAYPQVTGSLFAAIYRTLPNGTDFSVFSDAGWIGFNFAVIDGAHHYHQPSDTRENLDLRSLQHFGEHALRLGNRIAQDPDNPVPSATNAVFFDIVGAWVIQFPAWAAVPTSVVLLAVMLVVCGRRALKTSSIRATLTTWIGVLTAIVAAVLIGWMFSESILGTSLLPRPFVAHGHWLSFLLWWLVLGVVCATAHLFLRGIDQRAVWDAFWLGQAICSVLVAWLAPEFSHLVMIPAAMALITSLLIKSIHSRILVITAGQAILLIPVQHLLSIAIGPANGILLAAAFALTALPLLPVFGRAPRSESMDSKLRQVG